MIHLGLIYGQLQKPNQPKVMMVEKFKSIEKDKNRRDEEQCMFYDWIKYEFVALLFSNIILLIMIVIDIDENNWYYILLLLYCIISNVIFLRIIFKLLIFSATKTILLNQIISLLLNMIIPSILLNNGFIQILSPIAVLIITAEIIIMDCLSAISETSYCSFVGCHNNCTVFRMSGIYRLSSWHYYYEHVPYEFSYINSRIPPNKEEINYIINTLDNNENHVSVPFFVGTQE